MISPDRRPIFLASILTTGSLLSMTAGAVEKPNFDEHIKPLFRTHCLKCHGDDKQKADLNLQHYDSAMAGGSGGEAVVPGRSGQSLLFLSITDPDEDNRMPPNKPPLPKEEIDLIQKWIDGGVLQTSDSKSMVEVRDTSFTPAADAGGKPAEPVMPGELPEVPPAKTIRPLPVLALDTSPWAPLIAAAGQERVRLLDSKTGDELGALAFPEGIPHVIRFSRDGKVLMVAGGTPVRSGSVVLFDVETGKRLTTIGDEVDAVLAADLSPDQSLVALGGSGEIVKVYSTTDGSLQYKIEKHTDWITAVAFSPDSQTLATADRAGGIHLWDAASGGIKLSLSEHKASVKALDWRSDGKFLASAGEDGRIVWWDAKDGWPAINKTGAHQPKRPEGTYGDIPNGVLAARYDRHGRLVTAGRDGVVRVWDSAGKVVAKFVAETAEGDTSSLANLPLAAALSETDHRVVVGDSRGKVHLWQSKAK